MKKIVKIIILLGFIVMIKLAGTIIINSILINDFNNEKYDNKLVKMLYIFNFNEPYIAYYNEGTILLRQQKYKEALKKYEKALTYNIPKENICKVKTNWAYAKIMLSDSQSQETLKEVKKELSKDNCSLEIYQNESSSSAKDNNDNSQEDETKTTLKKEQKEAKQDREEKTEDYSNYSNIDNNYSSKMW